MTNDRAPASRRPAVIGVSVIALVSLALIGTTTPADAAPPANAGAGAGHTNATCPPHARALSYSDSLDKTQAFGVEVGGLSALARDRRTHTYAAIEDHTDDAPTRIWFLRDVAGPGDPSAVGTMVLRRPDGTPYNGSDFDAEGLTILPGGRFVTSSEVEPSIHVFGRDGVERAQLQVPDRFHVAPVGEAQDNATLEGLTASRGGRHIYAAMEGTLSGDVSPAGDDTYRRILVYDRGPIGYQLGKQVGYQVDPGMRIAEAQSYGHDSLLVLEAAWSPETGNLVRLYAVTGLRHAADVTDVPNLGADPSGVVDKQLVADVTACPDLGAPSREHQTNSLMDNYEAMTITHLRGHGGLHKGNGGLSKLVLLSDDNFNPAQFTRVLRLAADLP